MAFDPRTPAASGVLLPGAVPGPRSVVIPAETRDRALAGQSGIRNLQLDLFAGAGAGRERPRAAILLPFCRRIPLGRDFVDRVCLAQIALVRHAAMGVGRPVRRRSCGLHEPFWRRNTGPLLAAGPSTLLHFRGRRVVVPASAAVAHCNRDSLAGCWPPSLAYVLEFPACSRSSIRSKTIWR